MPQLFRVQKHTKAASVMHNSSKNCGCFPSYGPCTENKPCLKSSLWEVESFLCSCSRFTKMIRLYHLLK